MTDGEQRVFDVRYFKEPRGFINLGVHFDTNNKNMQLFFGRLHVSIGYHYDEVDPTNVWNSLLAYPDDGSDDIR